MAILATLVPGASSRAAALEPVSEDAADRGVRDLDELGALGADRGRVW